MKHGSATIVAQDWRALQWLHEDLRSDEEVIRIVVNHNFLCLTLALEDLLVSCMGFNFESLG